MTKPKIQIGNQSREMNNAEYAQWQADKAEVEAEAEAKAEKQVAREALLTRLGLTEQEAQLLLGS